MDLWIVGELESTEIILIVHCHPVGRGKEWLNELRIKEILRFCDVSDMGLI
jgi:hypothetical protein